MLSFLLANSDYAFTSGEIVGILKRMQGVDGYHIFSMFGFVDIFEIEN